MNTNKENTQYKLDNSEPITEVMAYIKLVSDSERNYREKAKRDAESAGESSAPKFDAEKEIYFSRRCVAKLAAGVESQRQNIEVLKKRLNRLSILLAVTILLLIGLAVKPYVMPSDTDAGAASVSCGQAEPVSTPVYTTPQGKKYHKKSCQALIGKKSLHQYNNSALAEDAGYSACGICFD